MNWKKFVLLGFAVACVFAASPATAQMRGHGSSIAPMPMQRAPMRNSASGFHHFNDGHFIRNDRFHRFHRFNEVIFIGDFGFPWWWGWGWGPWWGYPYGYDGGYNYGDYGSGYGDSSQSRVAELQRRLARAGYYHGAIDGILGPQTRRAIRAYERDHGGSAYGAIGGQLISFLC